MVRISVNICSTGQKNSVVTQAIALPNASTAAAAAAPPRGAAPAQGAARAAARTLRPTVAADELGPQARRCLTGAVLLAHLFGAWALLQIDVVRQAVVAAAPTIMVDMIAPPELLKPQPSPPAPQPQARQVVPAPIPLIAAAPSPNPAPASFIAPAPEVLAPAPVIAPLAPPSPAVTQVPAAAAPALKKVPPSAVRYVALPRLNFPLLSKRAHESGVVTLRIAVDVNGRLKDAWVHKSSGFERLDQQALLDIRSARFAPQMDDGKPVEWETLAPLAYDLDR